MALSKLLFFLTLAAGSLHVTRRRKFRKLTNVSRNNEPTSSLETVNMSKKRLDYLSWDDYFLAVAQLTAMRSKDPQTQVGACVVSPQRKIVGIGYNGFPNGCDDNALPWGRGGGMDDLESKYPYVCHAEMNAILNKNSADTFGCTVSNSRLGVACGHDGRCTSCYHSCYAFRQSGIKEVIYVSDKYHDSPSARASRRMFDLAQVYPHIRNIVRGSNAHAPSRLNTPPFR